MIEMRRAQLSFDDGLIAEEVGDLREDWMRHADRVLADEQIVAAATGGGRCGILFRQERGSGQSHGRQTCMCSQSVHQEP